MSTWEERMALKAAHRTEMERMAQAADEFAAGEACIDCELTGRHRDDPVAWLDAHDPDWRDRCSFDPTPTDSDTCRLCFDWLPYPGGKAHFGYAWWRSCERGCPCFHHADEVWIG